MDIDTYRCHGLHRNFNDVNPGGKVNNRSNVEIAKALDTSGDRHYHPCPEAQTKPEVSAGNVDSIRGYAAS